MQGGERRLKQFKHIGGRKLAIFIGVKWIENLIYGLVKQLARNGKRTHLYNFYKYNSNWASQILIYKTMRNCQSKPIKKQNIVKYWKETLLKTLDIRYSLLKLFQLYNFINSIKLFLKGLSKVAKIIVNYYILVIA